MSTLRSLRDSGGPKAARTPNTFGAILRVATATELEGGLLRLTGTIQNDVPDHGTGLQVAVVFRGDDAPRALTNFIKGAGTKKALATPDAAEGSTVSLESCYLTEEKHEGLPVVSSRWVNTIISSFARDHDKRSTLEAVYATSPKVAFKNPDFRPGAEEPELITVPVAQEKFTARVATEHGTFTREFDRSWAIEKLKRLDKSDKPQVFIDTVEPGESVAIASREELERVLTQQLSRGTRALAMLRVSDGDEIVDRLVYGSYKNEGGNYMPDPERTIKDLLENNIFRGVPNDSLFQGLENGTLTVESIPGYRLNYAGNPTVDDNAAFKMVQDLAAGKTTRYEVMFGKDGPNYASVLLPGIDRDGSIAGFSPMNVIADRPGRVLAAELVTPVINPLAPKAVAEEPAEAPAP